MQELITSFLIQNKKCSLPGIGKFNIVTKPAELDVANKRMLPLSTGAGLLTCDWALLYLALLEPTIQKKQPFQSNRTNSNAFAFLSIIINCTNVLPVNWMFYKSGSFRIFMQVIKPLTIHLFCVKQNRMK